MIAVINLLAVILGIRGGFSVGDADTYLWSHSCNTFLFLAGKRSIFSYYFMELLTSLLVLALLSLCSVHFILSFLCFAILFFRTYLFALYLSLYIMLLKVSVLPFILLCMLPCYLLCMLLFSVVAVLSFNRARDAWRYGSGCNSSFLRFLRAMILPCIMIAILQILCTILAYFLTFGIIL